MLLRRMLERAPSVKVIGIARLEGFALNWHKRSGDGSGKCDVQETERSLDVVWGVVQTMLPEDKKRLDEYEGLGAGYGERLVSAWLAEEIVLPHVYYATRTDPTLKPYDWYRDLVVAGAKENGLPEAYIQGLCAVVAQVDPDKKREAENRVLIP